MSSSKELLAEICPDKLWMTYIHSFYRDYYDVDDDIPKVIRRRKVFLNQKSALKSCQQWAQWYGPFINHLCLVELSDKPPRFLLNWTPNKRCFFCKRKISRFYTFNNPKFAQYDYKQSCRDCVGNYVWNYMYDKGIVNRDDQFLSAKTAQLITPEIIIAAKELMLKQQEDFIIEEPCETKQLSFDDLTKPKKRKKPVEAPLISAYVRMDDQGYIRANVLR